MTNVNVNKLRGKIVENGLNMSTLAIKLGIDRSTLYRKVNSEGDKLTIKEANEIVELLNLDSKEAMTIFFWKFSRIWSDKIKKGGTNIERITNVIQF